MVQEVCQGDKSLEDEQCSGHLLQVDSSQLRAVIKVDPFATTQEVAEELNITHSTIQNCNYFCTNLLSLQSSSKDVYND